jgi:phage terminase small subunit
MTPKQEAFARAYVETGNASEAYRQAYDAENMKPDVVKVKACELLKNGNVAVTVANLKASLQKRHEITVDTITAMLKEDRELAKENKQSSAAVSASMGLAKLHGLIVDKAEHTGKGGAPLVPVLNVGIGRDQSKLAS